MTIRKSKLLYLDITKPNAEDNFYLINAKNKLVGEITSDEYTKHPENYLNDEITSIRYTGLRKKKLTKSKIKRTCRCKK